MSDSFNRETKINNFISGDEDQNVNQSKDNNQPAF
jgi:hypothetical protein